MSSHEHERLSAYLDGELPPQEMAEVAAHVAACAECAARLAEWGAVDEAAAELAAAAPSGYFDALPARMRARLAPHPAARRLPAWTWAAAAALLLAVVTPFTLSQRPRPDAGVPEVLPAAVPPTAAGAGAATAAPAANAALEAPRAEPRQAERRPPGAPSATPSAAASNQAAAPAAPLTREPEFARAPADAELGVPRQPAPTAEGRREAASPAARAPLPATPGARAGAPAAPARDTAAVAATAVAQDELQAQAPEQAVAVSEEKAADAAAGVPGQAAPAAKAARSQAAGRMAEMSPAEAGKTGPEEEWRRLQAARPQTAAEWRRLREELRRFATAEPDGPHADAARVRTIEAGYAAWRAGGDAADEAVFRSDAAAYLEREDALAKPHVRELLR